MSKKNDYGLEFVKISNKEKIGYNCIRKDGIVDKNNLLQFLSFLDQEGTKFLLHEINGYLTNIPNPIWTPYHSMVLEHVDLQIDYPNFIIDEQPYLFPLIDIKELLYEWLEFIS